MPEILEIEMYRRGAATVVGRTIVAVHAPDAWYLKDIDSVALAAELADAEITQVDRIGKLLVLDTTAGSIGLRFGMTGRLVIDDDPIIDSLEYSAKRLAPEWNRFGLVLHDGGSLVVNDPRRLGSVAFPPDTSRLGVDAWTIDAERFAKVVHGRTSALKSLLLNQHRIAGLGNLLADELCFRAGVAPGRDIASLSDQQVSTIGALIVPMLDELMARGGSHRGDHFEYRAADASCPLDGASMVHGTIAGRSSWWCPQHQR